MPLMYKYEYWIKTQSKIFTKQNSSTENKSSKRWLLQDMTALKTS